MLCCYSSTYEHVKKSSDFRTVKSISAFCLCPQFLAARGEAQKPVALLRVFGPQGYATCRADNDHGYAQSCGLAGHET